MLLIFQYVFQGIRMFSGSFAEDFGDEIGSFATLIDPNNNQLELLVEKTNDRVLLKSL